MTLYLASMANALLTTTLPQRVRVLQDTEDAYAKKVGLIMGGDLGGLGGRSP